MKITPRGIFVKKNKGEVSMHKATIQLETLTCPSCIQKIENATKGLDGVDKESVKVMFNSSKLKLDFDSEKLSVEDVEKAITALGYEVKKSQVKAK
jgi:copper chaperone CopZ